MEYVLSIETEVAPTFGRDRVGSCSRQSIPNESTIRDGRQNPSRFLDCRAISMAIAEAWLVTSPDVAVEILYDLSNSRRIE